MIQLKISFLTITSSTLFPSIRQQMQACGGPYMHAVNVSETIIKALPVMIRAVGVGLCSGELLATIETNTQDDSYCLL